MWPQSIFKLKLAIMAKCEAKDEASSGTDMNSNRTVTAGDGNCSNSRGINVNAVQLRIAVMSCLFIAFAAWCIFYAQTKYEEGTYLIASISVSSGVTVLLLSLICFDILGYDPSSSHTAKSLLFHYVLLSAIRTFGWLSWNTFKNASKNPKKYQHELLKRLLGTNAQTEYGKKYQFNLMKNKEEFKKKHPLTDFKHYSEYIGRIMNGEKNVLTKEDTVFVAMTSGTTADPKIFPVTKSYKFKTMWICLGVLHKFKSLMSLGRTQDFRCYPTPRKSPSGLDMGGITLHLFKPMPHHVAHPNYRKLYTEKAAFYAHAVQMLAERDMGSIEGYSSNLLYSFFKFIEQNINNICRDLAAGEVSQGFGIDDELREEICRNLHPDPERARFIKKEFSKGIQGIAKRIWSRLHYITCTKTGGFHHCAKLLENSYLQGIKLLTVMHVATEGNIGAMMEEDVNGTTFTFLPQSCFFEFIPEEQISEEQPETFFLDQLEKGKSYEIVVTNENGLCRYRLGDVIQVTGFYNNTPSYSFKHRTGQMLDVACERTPESIVYDSLQRAIKRFSSTSLIDYTTTESFHLDDITGDRTTGNAYIFYMEFERRAADLGVIEKHLDKCLCEDYVPYKIFRDAGSIAQLTIVQVKLGTFDELKRQIMGKYTNSQFKQPRVIHNKQHLHFLSQQTI